MGGTPFGKFSGRIKRYAKRFPKINFLEINFIPITKTKVPNIQATQQDWYMGLKKEKDASLNCIKSGMSLGYYSEAIGSLSYAVRDSAQHRVQIVRYTRGVLWMAHKKLKRNGKISIIVASEKKTGSNPYPTNGLKNILDSIVQTPFEKSFKVERIGKKEFSSLDYYEAEAAIEKKVPLFRVILTKL